MIWDIAMCILVLSWFSVHIYLSIKTFKEQRRVAKEQIAEIDRIYDELEKAVEKIKAGE
jgi:hypothetical protein